MIETLQFPQKGSSSQSGAVQQPAAPECGAATCCHPASRQAILQKRTWSGNQLIFTSRTLSRVRSAQHFDQSSTHFAENSFRVCALPPLPRDRAPKTTSCSAQLPSALQARIPGSIILSCVLSSSAKPCITQSEQRASRVLPKSAGSTLPSSHRGVAEQGTLDDNCWPLAVRAEL